MMSLQTFYCENRLYLCTTDISRITFSSEFAPNAILCTLGKRKSPVGKEKIAGLYSGATTCSAYATFNNVWPFGTNEEMI